MCYVRICFPKVKLCKTVFSEIVQAFVVPCFEAAENCVKTDTVYE